MFERQKKTGAEIRVQEGSPNGVPKRDPKVEAPSEMAERIGPLIPEHSLESKSRVTFLEPKCQKSWVTNKGFGPRAPPPPASLGGNPGDREFGL